MKNATTSNIVLMLTFVIAGFSVASFASASTWTESEGHQVGDIYTYGVKDSLSVYLVGRVCDYTGATGKSYFAINPTYVDNGSQLISMVLAAKMSGKKVRLFYDNTVDDKHCFVKGLRILQ